MFKQLTIILLVYNQLNVSFSSIKFIAGGDHTAGKIYIEWLNMFSKLYRKEHLEFEYKYLDNEKGKLWIKKQLTELRDLTPIFTGSDTPIDEKDHEEFSDLTVFPMIGNAVAVVFNIPNITELVLSRKVLVEVFLGHIKYWNDSQIQRYNPGLTLPYKEIQPVVYRNGAGITEVFTTALSAFSEEWKSGPGIFTDPELIDGINGEGPSQKWPGPVKLFAWKSNGVAAFVEGIPHAIGFLNVGKAKELKLKIATLLNEAGSSVSPSLITDGTTDSMNYFADNLEHEKHLILNLVNGPSDEAYPMPYLSYFIVNSTTSPGVSCEQMKLFVRFVHWALTDAKAVEISHEKNFIPLTKKVVKEIENRILGKITCKGQNVVLMIAREDAPGFSNGTNLIIFVSLGLVMVLLIGVPLFLSFKFPKIACYMECNACVVYVCLTSMFCAVCQQGP